MSLMNGASLAPVTTVIPTFNNRDTVMEAIQSVVDQTRPPEQIVVVDDGSTDGSPDLIRREWGSRVELVIQANGGPSRARNTGIAEARHAYVAFLDADDLWAPTKLANQLPFLEQDSHIGVVASDWVRHAAELPDTTSGHMPISRISYRDLLMLNRFQTSTVVARTALLREVGGFDPDVDGAEDWDLWVRLAARAQVMKLDVPLVVYRDVATGYSKDVWRVYETMQGLLDKHRREGSVPPNQFREIEAWHHMRFAVALLLIHDRKRAKMAWNAAWQSGRRGAAWQAFWRHLMPFLYGRWRKRTAP